MSGQKYKRTNFDDDDTTSTGGTPPGVTYDAAVAFKVGANVWEKRSTLERILTLAVIFLTIIIIILAAVLASKTTLGKIHFSSFISL